MIEKNQYPDNISEKLQELRQNYLLQLPTELAELNSIAKNLGRRGNDHEILQDLHYRLHKLAGSGGMYGAEELSKKAKLLEEQVQQWLHEAVKAPSSPLRKKFGRDLSNLISTLKAIKPTENQSSTLASQTDSTESDSVNIWLIENEKDIALAFTKQLEPFNYNIHLFSDPAAAIELSKSKTPSIMIIDIAFAGFSTKANKQSNLSELWQIDTAILAISSEDSFHSRARAAQLGVEGFYPKPIDIHKIVNRITRIMEKKRAPAPKVLIIDDDKNLADYYRLILLKAGMIADTLNQPEDMITKISQFQPELILMDLYMPVYSGPNLAGIIRQYNRWAGLPIVYLSAETDMDMQLQALRSGADAFLTKPISETRLIAAVLTQVERARELDAQINRDSLTGMLKHADIKETADIKIKQAIQSNSVTTIVMLDIDNFKQVNDSYGHAAGDMVISSIAMLLRQRLRQTDIIGRYGGEEFLAVLPNCNAQSAHALLDDIRQRFANIQFTHRKNKFSCTISAGYVATAAQSQLTGSLLIEAADSALYEAKHSGRNCIVSA